MIKEFQQVLYGEAKEIYIPASSEQQQKYISVSLSHSRSKIPAKLKDIIDIQRVTVNNMLFIKVSKVEPTKCFRMVEGKLVPCSE
jgi:hypothetical protein